MILEQADQRIVLVGFWNPMIFSPQWIGNGRLTDQENIDIMVPLNNPTQGTRYHFDNIILTVFNTRIHIGSKGLGQSELEKQAAIATRILEDLAHTPVSAVGVNFKFTVQEPSPELFSILPSSNMEDVAELGYSLNHQSSTRNLVKGDLVLNVKTDHKIESNTVDIEFNHHQSIDTAAGAVKYLAENADNLYEESTAFLINVYKLQITSTDED